MLFFIKEKKQKNDSKFITKGEKMNNIEELIQEHLEIKKRIDELNNRDEAIKAEIKLFLTEEGIDKFEDTSGNLVSYKEQSRESLDKDKVRSLIGDIQFKEVVKVSTFGVLKILSKESREKIQKSFKKNGKNA